MPSLVSCFTTILTAVCFVCFDPSSAWVWGTVQYNRDIRPILSDNCFACHGPDANKRAADLRLDIRDEAISSNAIAPNKPEESELIRRILSSDLESVMPPPTSHKSLTPAQKDLLKQWIAEGAEYQGHWAFIPPTKPELPQVRNNAWGRNPIDRFVLSELERRGLEPSPEAELRSLIRRVCYDLTGLPPTPEEIERVIADPSPNRYENYVDELLKRPEWGEHRGRHWLDYARYADTHGIHFDNYREMWSYREWVIKAFNRNMPFDQFTIEQLAGDLLTNPDLDQLIATGFNRCNITTNEGGIIDEEYRVLYTRDRVETTGLVWMGLTAGCAVCHDHKFDPISQSEFYQLAAYFNNTTQNVRDGNIKDPPPIVSVPLDADRERARELETVGTQLEQAIGARREASRKPFEEYVASPLANREQWSTPEEIPVLETHIPLLGSEKRWLDVVHRSEFHRVPLDHDANLVDGHIGEQAWQVKESFPQLPIGDLERDQSFTVMLWVKPGSPRQDGALIARMDEADAHRGWDVWTEAGSVGMHLIHKWPDNALKVVSKPKLAANKWNHVAITYDGSSKAEGLKIYLNGSEVEKTVQGKAVSESTRTSVPLTIGKRHTTSPATGASIQDIRIYKSPLSVNQISTVSNGMRRSFLITKKNRTKEETEDLLTWYVASKDSESARLSEELSKVQSERNAIKNRGTVAHVMNEAKTAPMAHVLTRGDYDKRGQEVKAATPKFLLPMPEEFPTNRLGLAKWLLLPAHPLTARVTVNRFWQEVFGQGIVASSGDFGTTGQLPSHPELLDYLAVSFQEDHWNIKNLFRQIVTSATYRQSAGASPERLAMDPQNKLFSRGPRFRMDAEMIRDTALAVSGLLVSKIGGPSVRPYQPLGVWEAVAMPGSNTRDYVIDKGEGLYRRSLYTFLKRAAPPPNMETFNATAREVCTVRRERTNTPLQALVTLNDPQFVEAARMLATSLLLDKSVGTDVSNRIQWLAHKLVGRPFRVEEIHIVQTGWFDLYEYFKQKPDGAKALLAVGAARSDASLDAVELAAWTMMVNQLLNLDEVLNK